MEPRTIRKYQNRLKTAGIGVILFSVWNIIKSVISELYTDKGAFSALRDSGYTVITNSVVIGISILVVAVAVWLELYVGRSAIKEANGLKISNNYIIIAVIQIILSVISIIYYIRKAVFDEFSLLLISDILIEIIAQYVLIQLIRSAVILRKNMSSEQGKTVNI